MAGLTLVPEGSGSLLRLQTVHGLHCLRYRCPRGCRTRDETGSTNLFKYVDWLFMVYEHPTL